MLVNGITIPAITNTAIRIKNGFCTRPERSKDDARSSNASDRESHRNLSVCVINWAAPPATAAQAVHGASDTFSARTNRGPRNNAVA